MYSPEDFTRMKHNPLACKQGQRIWHKYPDLQRQKALCVPPDMAMFASEGKKPVFIVPDERELDQMVRFVIFLVEPIGNPIAKERNFDARVDLALGMANIKKDSKGIWHFISTDHWWYRDVIFEYFRLINDDLYTLWFSMKIAFANNMAAMRQHITYETNESFISMVQKLKLSAPDDLKKIQELEARIFPDERTREIVSSSATRTNAMIAESYAAEGNLQHFLEI